MKLVWMVMYLILVGVPSSLADSSEFTEAHLVWENASYALRNGTATAKIILTDNDSNVNPNYKEKVNAFVFSDSFVEEMILELYETEKNSGIFERAFTISDSRSAPSILFAQVGDTATVHYIDDTLPPAYSVSSVDLQSTSLIDILDNGPLDRAPVKNPKITDVNHHSVHSPIVGKQYLISSDFANNQNHQQDFVWFAQIQDETKETVSLSWINGTLSPSDHSESEISWIPQREGNYNVTFFIWESLVNPSALSPPVSLDFQVLPSESSKIHASQSLIDHNLIEAKNNIREIYSINPSLGPFKVKDAIVDYGVGDGFLIIHVLEEYYNSDDARELIIKKITAATNEKVDIEFSPSGALLPETFESIFPYVWNDYLNGNDIDFFPKGNSYGNNDDGFRNPDRVCSPLISPDGTDFFISSTFNLEPFEITGTFIDKIEPEDCHKFWKTETNPVEPDGLLGLWLENYYSNN